MRSVFDFWDEMAALERRMDDIVREFLGTRARLSYPASPEFIRKPFAPAADVFARDGDFVVKLELPGMEPERDVTVEVRDQTLVIKGERKQTEEVKERDYHRMEASYGAFERHIPIPVGIDEGAIKATYVDGVLEVVVPKGAAKEQLPKARRIPVLTEGKPAKAA